MHVILRKILPAILFFAFTGIVSGQQGNAPAIEFTEPMAPVTPVTSPPTGVPLAGDTTITAAVVQAQDLLDKQLQSTAEANGDGTSAGLYDNNSFNYYVAEYNDFQSTPYLYIMGLNLGKLLNDAFFKFALASAMAAFVAISISKKMTEGGSSGNPDFYGTLSLKVFAAGLIFAYPSHIYAAARTVMNVGSEVVVAMQKVADDAPGGVISRMTEVASQSGTRDLEIRVLRDRAIRNGIASREGVMTRFVDRPELDEATLDYWAYFLNQFAPAQAAAYTNSKTYPRLPRVGEAPLEEIRRQVLARFSALTVDSGGVSPGFTKRADFSMDWEFKDYSVSRAAISISPLAYKIQVVTAATVAEIQKSPSTAAGQSARSELLSQYEQSVALATANWIDSEYLDRFAVAMKGESRLWGIVRDIGTWTKRAALSTGAALSPDTLADKVASSLSVFTSIVKTFIIPLISLIMCFCLRILLELSLLGVLVALPFWFFEGTKKAFTGAVETLVACSIMVPFWQFFQMIMDLLFSALTAIVMLGAGLTAVAGGVTAPTLAVLAVMMAVGYIIASGILAFKTPALVKGFLAGGSWITGVIGTALTGVAAGAFMTVAAAAAIAAPAAAGVVGAAGAGSAGAAGGAGASAAGGAAGSLAGGAASAGAGSSSFGSYAATTLKRGMSGAGNALKHLAMNDFKPMAATKSYAKERAQKGSAQETTV